MRKVVYGPYFRFLIKLLENKKIIGQASKEELKKIFKQISKTLYKSQSIMSEEQIFNGLIKNCKKIVYTEQIPTFGGTDGFSIGKSVFIDKDFVDRSLLSEGDLHDNHEYGVIVHECIHTLQNRITYKGKSIKGFAEGATQLMEIKAVKKNRSYNLTENRRYSS